MRPYRLNCGNNVDILVLALLAILSLSFPTALYHFSRTAFILSVLISALLLGIAHMVLISSLCHKFANNWGYSLSKNET